MGFPTFPQWREGQQLTAKWVNEVQKFIQQLVAKEIDSTSANLPQTRFRFVEVTVDDGSGDYTAKVLERDSTQAIGSQWAVSGVEIKFHVPDDDVPYQVGDELFIYFHHQSGKYIPVREPRIVYGKTDDILRPVATDTVTISVYRWNLSTDAWEDTAVNVVAENKEKSQWLYSGDFVVARQSHYDDVANEFRYHVIWPEGRAAIGQADSDITAGANGTVSIYSWVGGIFTDTGQVITNVRNTSGVTIASDKKCSVFYIPNQWLAVPLEC